MDFHSEKWMRIQVKICAHMLQVKSIHMGMGKEFACTSSLEVNKWWSSSSVGESIDAEELLPGFDLPLSAIELACKCNDGCISLWLGQSKPFFLWIW